MGTSPDNPLDTRDHSRDAAGLRYVYPVVSRRAGGLSVGINLNPNNACNWRCVYCQVPDLKKGSAPAIDLDRLTAELRDFLEPVMNGDYLARHLPEGMRRLNDIALSGNGEPTSARQFAAVIERIGAVMREMRLLGRIRLLLITNGSFAHRPTLRHGLEAMRPLGGEIWFKLDSATTAGMARINHAQATPALLLRRLAAHAERCQTWIQTCVFAWDGAPPDPAERDAYLQFLAAARRRGIPLAGVLLYGLARPSLQPEAGRIGALPEQWLRNLARDIDALGLAARVHV